MMELIWPGPLVAQAIHVAARLGLADLLADGPRSADEIASAIGAHAPSLRRLLRAMASVAIFNKDDDGRFSRTPLSDALRSGAPMRDWAIMLGSPFVWRPWGRLHEVVMTGDCAFDAEFGVVFHEYMARHPDEAEAYNAAMNAGSTAAASDIAAAYDFSKFRTIVDVGGGRGALLAGILDENPAARGVLFDLPEVLHDPERLQITRLGTRCGVEKGDFFEGVPAGDALLLKSILHALDDAQAGRLLHNCHQALDPNGRLILVETVLEPADEPQPHKAMMDLMMLSLTAGHERTAQQFETLLSAARFELLSIVSTQRGHSIIEAAPR